MIINRYSIIRKLGIRFKSMANLGSSSGASRQKRLVGDYIAARRDGHLSGYDIRQVNPDSFEHFYILIKPLNGVYKGNKYIIELKTEYGHDNDISRYPIDMPYVHFVTDVFHVNISPKGGSICVDLLKDKTKWVPSNSFDTIMQNILLLFGEPNNASPYNHEASKLWSECENIFRSRKKELGHKAPIADVDNLYAECFAPFSDRVQKAAKKNNLSQYYKYFPELDLKSDPEIYANYVSEEKAIFESILADFDTKYGKKKNDVDNTKPVVAKPNRWVKYQNKN